MFSTETEVKYKSTLLYPEILSYFIHFLIANIFKTHTYIITFKKAFFSDQCKETEENNRMGKTRDLRGGKNILKNCTKKIFPTWIITMV